METECERRGVSQRHIRRHVGTMGGKEEKVRHKKAETNRAH